MRRPQTLLISFFVTLGCLLLFSSISQATTAQEIQNRMKARYPTIVSMKDKGIIGENNIGLLEFRTKKSTNKKIIDAENSDRTTVYVAIAKKQGVSTKLVGARRAVAIAQNGKKGHIFQNKNGDWYVK